VNSIKHIVCVASGKGGVGKSTTAVNLALALAADNLRVGLLDADIYGPSIPLMLGVKKGTRPDIIDNKFIEPVRVHGLSCMSMGLLVDESTPMVWRAPMIISAFNQLLNDTLWGELDYLIVDMPPGTGDIQLSLTQKAKVTGAVIVTTPQDVALLDARKGIEMFRKVNVPILGVVENMSTYICSSCGHEESIFGSGGGEILSREYGVDVIGSLPLDKKIREQTDNGVPLAIIDPGGKLDVAYRNLASSLKQQVDELKGNENAPRISVSDD